eukprot:TRINITY_DN4410_c0_g1_i1.p1 TRINITY_DN4410_c0_g1~~TRINITY_DN4410_c0_g1_i1.p1  ORF type:complete len:51 (-),score=2.97 TRINITY_DN4410_c0_g1_i1:123-275(-)
MYRVPTKEGTPADKDAEKRKARQQVKKQFLTYVGIILTLRIAPYALGYFS